MGFKRCKDWPAVCLGLSGDQGARESVGEIHSWVSVSTLSV